MPDFAQAVERIAIFALPLLLGVTCHEVMHGYAALLQGDDTAKRAGRLTLNPARHLDPTGTMVFVLTALLSPFVIGWAKPVPVNFQRLRNLRQGMILVSLAGPMTNFALAVAFALVYHLLLAFSGGGPSADWILRPLILMSQAGVLVTLAQGMFNLLPVTPLDGSKILVGILPPALARKYLAVERYGLIIVVILLATGILGRLVVPPLTAMARFLLN